jgi:hypothetical protein
MEDIIFENDSFVIELQKEEIGGEVMSYSQDGINYDLNDTIDTDFSIVINVS